MWHLHVLNAKASRLLLVVWSPRFCFTCLLGFSLFIFKTLSQMQCCVWRRVAKSLGLIPVHAVVVVYSLMTIAHRALTILGWGKAKLVRLTEGQWPAHWLALAACWHKCRTSVIHWSVSGRRSGRRARVDISDSSGAPFYLHNSYRKSRPDHECLCALLDRFIRVSCACCIS